MIPLALLGLAALGGGDSGVEQDPIRVGEARHATLEAAASTPIFPFVSLESGTYTVLVRSFDFDAFARVESSEGTLAAESDGGEVETNARVVFEADPARAYRVVVRGSGAGEFEVVVEKGEIPPPQEEALLEAATAYRVEAARRALARGEKAWAAFHRAREADLWYGASHHHEARVAYQAALDLAREAADAGIEARALGGLGIVCRFLGEFDAAREHLERYLENARQRSDRVAEAWVLGALGNLAFSRSDHETAKARYAQAARASRQLGDRRGVAAALENLGGALLYLSENEAALPPLEEALEIAREIGDAGLQSSVLASLASAREAVGDPEGARACYESQLALARESRDPSLESSAVGNLSDLAFGLADYRESRRRAQESLALAEQAADPAAVGAARGRLGLATLALGDYAEAEEQLEGQLEYFRGVGDAGGEISTLGNLGILYARLGELERARECHERHRAMSRETGNTEAEAAALSNLLNVHLALGALAEARECAERLLESARARRDPNAEAWARAARGEVLYRAGELAEARAALERALSSPPEAIRPNTRARILGTLAFVLLDLGETGSARRLAQEAFDYYDGVGLEVSSLGPLRAIASAALDEGDLDAARGALREADRRLSETSPSSLDRPGAAGARSRYFEWGEVAQDLASRALDGVPRSGDAAAATEGFVAAGLWKGRSLLEGIVEHRRGGRTAEVLRLRRESRETRATRDGVLARLSRAIREGRPRPEIAGLREEAGRLSASAESLARRLEEVSPRDAALDAPRGLSPAAIRSGVLSPGTILVEYAEGRRRTYAYVLTPTDLSFVDLGERDALGREVDRFLSLVRSPDALGSVRDVAETGHRLYRTLLAPLLPPDAKRIVVVPTPALATLPFEALVVRVGNGDSPASFSDLEFVLDRCEVAYGPSSPVLLELASIGPRPDAGRMLVLADPVYPTEAGEREPSEGVPALLAGREGRSIPASGTLERLERTRDEARAVADLLVGDDEEALVRLARLMRERSGTLETPLLRLHLGAAASPRVLREDLRPYSVLHFAAHGFVDLEFPRRTGIALAFSEGVEGFFTMAEALDLDLDANLVVLSACDTARGKVRAGEGVLSLARAFLYAGARHVVASLWPVADWAASETMAAFYRGALQDGRSPSAALRAAKLGLRRSRALRGVAAVSGGTGGSIESGHPFFWAPFIHVGLPR